MKLTPLIALIFIAFCLNANAEDAGKKCETEFNTLVNKANADDVQSQFSLGHIYFEGICVEKNLQLAGQWYEKAANNGHAGAMFNLFHVYGNAQNGYWNEEKAKYWLLQAGKAGEIRAYYPLITVYEHGVWGFPKDLEKSKYWKSKWEENKHLLK